MCLFVILIKETKVCVLDSNKFFCVVFILIPLSLLSCFSNVFMISFDNVSLFGPKFVSVVFIRVCVVLGFVFEYRMLLVLL